MTGILKVFPFAIAYQGQIIIFSTSPQKHLSHICMVFEKLRSANLPMKSKCSFFSKEIHYLGHILSVMGIQPHYLLKLMQYNIWNWQQHLRRWELSLRLVGYYRKFIRVFAKTTKLLTLLTRQQVKFDWTPEHHEAFLHLKEAIVEAPILHYPNPNKKYILYTDTSDDTCGVQLSQEYNGTEFSVAFLSHTFMETQCKWSTTEQEAFVVYYATTKWNHYLQGADITVQNDHKPLVRFLLW